MKKIEVDSKILTAIFLLMAGIILFIESYLKNATDGSLLLILLFWVSVLEGCIALVAISDISKGEWLLPVKKNLLSVYPLLLLISFLFLFLTPQFNNIYPWIKEDGLWLGKNIFIMRNFIVLILTYYLARKFAQNSVVGSEKKNFYAVLYMLIFVISQSLAAFDWVMSLEYPWFSTLFGGYFFVESIYCGIAMSGIYCFILLKRPYAENFKRIEKTLIDTATMIFGFSLLWAGLFYAQFLVIWYGNLPEERDIMVRIASSSPLRKLSYLVLFNLFFGPFVALLSRRAKSNRYVVLLASLLILSGIFIERVILLFPHLSLNPLTVLLEFLCLGLLFIFFNISRELFFRSTTKSV